MTRAKPLPRFAVQNYFSLGPAAARAVIVTDNKPGITTAALDEACRDAFKSRVYVVPGSGRVESKAYAPAGHLIVSAILARTNAMLADETASYEGKHQITANTWMDEKDSSIWTVAGAESGSRYLIRRDETDISNLLSAAIQPAGLCATTLTTPRIDIGDIVFWHSPSYQEVVAGFALPGHVYDPRAGVICAMSPQAVSQRRQIAPNSPDAPNAEIAARMAAVTHSHVVAANAMISLRPILDFWAGLFGKNTSFFRDLEAQIRDSDIA